MQTSWTCCGYSLFCDTHLSTWLIGVTLGWYGHPALCITLINDEEMYDAEPLPLHTLPPVALPCLAAFSFHLYYWIMSPMVTGIYCWLVLFLIQNPAG